MFKNIARTLSSIARASIQPAQRQHATVSLSASELAFTGRGKGGKVSHKVGNAAALKRASTKRANIHKFN